MKKLLLSVIFVPALYSASVIFKNDTNATYFAVCGDKGSLLEPKKECTCELPEITWWQKFWNTQGVMLFKQTSNGNFVQTFTISPKKGDEPVTILVSDIHRKVRNVEQPFNVKTSKRITSRPVRKKITKPSA
jgi:hypothetical protein